MNSKIGRHIIILLALLTLVLTSCVGTKHLPANANLIKKVKIEFKNPKKIDHQRQLKAELQLKAKPIPNYGLGGFNLWVYNITSKNKKKKGFRHWLKKAFGRAPQLYDRKVVNRSKLVLEKHLKDQGYFGATVNIDTTVKKQQMSLIFRVESKGRFIVNSLNFPDDTTAIGRLINQYQKGTKIKINKPYSKLAIDKERLRLAQIAGRHGYMYFQENNLFFLVDTTKGGQQADLYLKIEQPSDSLLHRPFQVGKTVVYPTYLLEDTVGIAHWDTSYHKEIQIIQPLEIIKPKVITRNIYQRTGDLINRDLQDIGVSHLLDLGLFKFVRLKYERNDSGHIKILDRNFYLTPGLTQKIQTEFQVNNRSGNFFGTAASIQYSHNNLFRGAEQLLVKLSGGVETQSQNKERLINIFDLDAEVSLRLPKLLVPFKKIRRRPFLFVPKTRISLSANFQERRDFYNINSTSLKFGYEWKQNANLRHQFNLLNFNQLNVWNKSAAFIAILADDTRLENSFENVFIMGSTYTLTYTSTPQNEVSPYLFFRTDISSSGNLLSLIAKQKASGEKTDLLWGRVYAQFFRITPDLRYYIPRRKSVWASRFLFGIGIPYGNSNELPYVEQYFAGGANSIRAFQFRGVGPGTYLNESLETNGQLLDQTGDIKLEMNLEYRFDMVKYLEGALFMDVGNVWLLDSDTRPNGVFEFNRFYKELAVGTGFGLRLDFDFFVIRLDAAFPLRQPIRNGEMGWTLGDISLLKRDWRQENIIYNLGIGYPF